MRLEQSPKELVKGLEDLEIRGQVEKIQTTSWYSGYHEYREEFWRLEEICCHSNSGEKRSANADVKNSQRSK